MTTEHLFVLLFCFTGLSVMISDRLKIKYSGGKYTKRKPNRKRK